MGSATIGDDVRTLYQFDWGDHSRTTDEIGDLSVLEDVTLDDIVDVARGDPECEVNIIGFEQT